MAMAAEAQTKTAHRLNELLALDYDAISAYEAAIEKLDDPNYRTQLKHFKSDHEQHVGALTDKVRELGHKPQAHGDMKKVLTTGRVAIGNITGDKGILKAMHSNEDETNAAYESALRELKGSVELSNLLQENLEDERQHRTWIEQTLRAMG